MASGVAAAQSAPAPAPQWTAPAAPSVAPSPPAASAAPPAAASPAAEAAPPTVVPLAPPPAVAPPPAAYPYPYSYPAYPAYPPPPGYGYAYYYPPAPPVPPKPRYPADAAASTTPFLDLVLVGVAWENRFSQFLNVGAQGGLFLGGRLRLTARIALPTETLDDEYYDSGYNYSSRQVDSKSASFLYGASAGIVAVSTQTFVMSPGIAFGRSDVSDYGSMLAFSMPFDWVMSTGMRVGLEADFGRAFGGRAGVIDCPSGSCAAGPNLQTHDRPAGTAFWLQFNMGFGFNHPAPLPLAPAALPPSAPR